MFRQRLSFALIILALAFVMQGAVAWWAIHEATNHVERGRVASDLLKAYLELSGTKQRLRSWVSQALLQVDVDTQLRDRYQQDIVLTLDKIESLALRSAELDDDDERGQQELQKRKETLDVLRRSMAELRTALTSVRLDSQNMDPASIWTALSQTFDSSQGRDLRRLLADTIAKEQIAVQRERAAADRSLAWVAAGALGATLVIATAAVVMAMYFGRALRQPLDELSEGAQALQRGDLEHRIPDQRDDEFAQLAKAVNAMAQELQHHRVRETEVRLDLESQVKARTTELEQAIQALQAVDTSRRRLFADISHELRTPTTAILGEAEIALRGQEKVVSEYQDTLRRIAQIAGQLARIIDDLLTMARSDAHSLSIQYQPVHVQQPVKESLQQAQSLADGCQVTLDFQDNAESGCTVMGDAARLRQLIMVLLDNAIRYSYAGGTVFVRSRMLDEEGTYWQLEIGNHGVAIAPDELPKVFDRDFRGQQARTHRADGLGLGLALAQSLTKAHDGDLLLTCEEDGVTIAQLTLPCISNGNMA